MGILSFFNRTNQRQRYDRYKELGSYNAHFAYFGKDPYQSEIVRSCVRPLAEFTSKAQARCSDAKLERLLNNRPNQFMNGRDFLQKIRLITELKNTCFIYIQRDNRGSVSGLYPVPYSGFEAMEYANGLFVRFTFAGEAAQKLVLPWEDLAVLRRDYYMGDIAGENNGAILNTLQMISTMEQGLSNAVKATANLRGILKSTKTMLSPDDVRKQKEQFVKDYLSLENEGGIASLDGTQEFTPINMSPITATYDQVRECRENVYRYFGVNDNIVMGNMNAEQVETFYELKIEPFLAQLSAELTSKIYTKRELNFDNWIVYEQNKLAFASLDKKIKLFSTVVLYGGMTVNEWRLACNMVPIDGGDDRVMRLDAGTVDETGNPINRREDEEDAEEGEENG